jgi:hypothetical protein
MKHLAVIFSALIIFASCVKQKNDYAPTTNNNNSTVTIPKQHYINITYKGKTQYLPDSIISVGSFGGLDMGVNNMNGLFSFWTYAGAPNDSMVIHLKFDMGPYNASGMSLHINADKVARTSNEITAMDSLSGKYLISSGTYILEVGGTKHNGADSTLNYLSVSATDNSSITGKFVILDDEMNVIKGDFCIHYAYQ